MAHAEETCDAGNQVAANCAGIPKMKIWEIAIMVWPVNMSAYCDLPVANTLIQLPAQVPNDPRITDSRRPCKTIAYIVYRTHCSLATSIGKLCESRLGALKNACTVICKVLDITHFDMACIHFWHRYIDLRHGNKWMVSPPPSPQHAAHASSLSTLFFS